MLSSFKCFCIVIKDDERSNYYHNYCKNSWKSIGLDVKVFDAITPENLKKHSDLTFEQYSSASKYLIRNLKAPISATEKACFYSHFRLWQECVYLNEPVVILEHDSLLEEPERVWYSDEFGIIFYDKAAMGSYVIHPWIAKKLIHYAYTASISYGPYALIERFSREYSLQDSVVNNRHPKYSPASNQVMSEKYGNTISHYSNEHTTLFGNECFHNFITIP